MKPEQLKEKLEKKENFVLLDVREPEEFAIANLGGILIPLSDLPSRYDELNPNDEIVVMCHHGVRSMHAVGFLKQKGFENIKNLSGGIDAYSHRVDPSIPRY